MVLTMLLPPAVSSALHPAAAAVQWHTYCVQSIKFSVPALIIRSLCLIAKETSHMHLQSCTATARHTCVK